MLRTTLALPMVLSGVRRAAPAPPVAAPTPSPAQMQAAADARAFADLLGSLTQLVDQLRQQRARTAEGLAQQSVAIGVAIAERLLGQHLALDRQRLDEIVLRSLRHLPASGKVVVRLHAADLALLQRQMQEHGVLDLHRDRLEFKQDPAGVRGRLTLDAEDLFVEWDTQRSLQEMASLLHEQAFEEGSAWPG